MNALKRINEKDILFFDIETALIEPTIEKGSLTYDSWDYYCKRNGIEEKDVVATYEDKAVLYAEYSKVICISVGIIAPDGIRIKTIKGSEQKILESFDKVLNHKDYILCGHTIKGFDIPFLFKRYIVNELEIPDTLDVSDKKPWEIKHIDVAELWKGSGWVKSSLISMTLALNLDNPKTEFDGNGVSKIYQNGGINDIVKYCERDVKAVIDIYKKFTR